MHFFTDGAGKSGGDEEEGGRSSERKVWDNEGEQVAYSYRFII